MLGNNMKCEVRNQYIVTNYMEQGPLEPDSFAGSRFVDIPQTPLAYFVFYQGSVTDIFLNYTSTEYTPYTPREYG